MIRILPDQRLFRSRSSIASTKGGLLVLALFLVVPLPSRVDARENDSEAQPISFELDVQPILTAHGCNAGACHGKQRGQNGFQLSLLGFDSEFDYAAITRESRGRRIFPASPDQSLLLRKSTAIEPHGGGQRIALNGEDYDILREWIAQGAPRRIPNEAKLERVELNHEQLRLAPGQTGALQLTAFYSDGTTRDVTSRTTFQSNDGPIARVDRSGAVTAGDLPGETAIMARFMQHIAVCNVLIPLSTTEETFDYSTLPRNNFVDELVWNKLAQLGLRPSEPVSDAKYMRRVYIDIVGRLPTVDEAQTFLADSRADRRERLVDQLLESTEYADHWSNLWMDLLRPNPYRVGIKAVLNYDDWIRGHFRDNTPYDEFARGLITATGSTWTNGAATLYRDRRSPDEIATLTSRLFLGVRLECAKCHHHPFERWGQEDFYGFAAYFARVGRKGTGLSPPISGGEEIVLVAKSGSVSHPLTGERIEPRPLFGEAPAIDANQDPRSALADWMTSPDNSLFAQVQANRIWTSMMGRGVVEPVDDLRSTNPAVNQSLLDGLADHFRASGFDNKALIRAIATSHVYAISSVPNDFNQADLRNYSRNYRRRLRAEVLIDSIVRITGIDNRFSGMPAGSQAKQIWTHRVGSLFLDTFGRPNPNQDPPCERMEEPTVTQTLHLMNAPELHRRVTSDQGTAAKWAAGDLPPQEIINHVFLSIYSRYPDEEEMQIGLSMYNADGAERRRVTEDLMWALLNTPEFVFRD